MKLFLANAEVYMKLFAKTEVNHLLISFFNYRNDMSKDMLNFNYKPEIFLDSGGFSVRVSGKKADFRYMKDYMNFIKLNKRYLSIYANLDMTTPELTMRNQKIMESIGLTPVPVYHGTEPIEIFKELCEKYKYICVGGLSGTGMEQNLIYARLRRCVKIAMEYKTKIHAFGVTSPLVLKTINLYSCDSSSWLTGGKYGGIYFFDKRRKKLLSITKQAFKENYGKYFNTRKKISELGGINIWNLRQWKLYADYLEDFWKGKEYWEG